MPTDDKALLQEARNQYQDDDLRIDDNAKVSRVDGGAWIQAWVYLAIYPDDSHEEHVHELELVP